MKRKNIKLLAFLVLGGNLLATSCSEEKTTEHKATQEEHTTQHDQVAEEEETNTGFDVNSIELDPDVNYQVPTPNELFTLIKETNVKFDESILNDADNLSKYDSPKAQALNFGVYSADLAFISSFEIGTEALKYFKTIRELSNKLHVDNAFDGTVFKRIEENANSGSKDSLLNLSNETYYKAFTYLEDNGREKTLAYIVLGGWIESLYILTEVGTFEEGNTLAEKIGDQKLTLENIMGMMMKLQDDEEVTDVMSELQDLEEAFMNLEMVEDGEVENTQQENGTFMFSGGTKTIVTKDDFEKIKEIVKELRTQIVEGNL